MANLSSSSSQINEARTFNDNIFETVSPSWPSKVPQDEHLDSDDDSVQEDYTIQYDQYLATKESQDVPTEASLIPPTAAYMLQTLTDLTTQVEGHRKFVPQKELSREQVYWLSASNIASQSSDPPKPVTPFVHTRPVNSECFDEEVIPFFNNIKQLFQLLDHNIYMEVKEFERIFDELDSEYEQTVLANKNLQIEKKNLLIKNECLIFDSISKVICSIVLASEREVLQRSNCQCEELQTTCDREHSRVLELEAKIAKIAEKQQMLAKSKNQNSLIQKQFVDLQVKFQNYKECLRNQKVCEQPNATASNAIIEINKLKAQLQEKDDTIRHLHAEKDILGLLNVGYTESSFETKALETKISQLKEGLTSLKIQNDGYKKIATQKAEIGTLKVKAVGKKNSGPTGTPTKPKVLALGIYTKSSKTSLTSTQKPPVQHKKPTVPVNMFPKAKPATEARKPIPKRNIQNHNPLPAKSVKARRAADYYRNLYVDITQFVDRSTKSMHTKPHQAKRVMNTSTNAWNETKNTVTRIVPIWKPTEQDKENIIKASALPHDSPPRVTSLDADKGSMQHNLNELTDLCTRLQRQQTEMAFKITTQDLEITSLKARIKLLEEKDRGGVEPFGEDPTIKGKSLETREEAGVEKSTERGNNDIEELVNVLTSLDAASILTSGVQVVSVPPAAEVSTVSVPTGSGLVPTASPIFTTASVTPLFVKKTLCHNHGVSSKHI
nr:hypothetical protein [Tanacetum cinerariifolium]